MRAVYLTQEYAPYFADGGLGVVSNALPAELRERHHVHHDVVLPFYPRLVHRYGLRTEQLLTLPRQEATVHRLLDAGAGNDIYLVRADAWYDRPQIYRDDSYQPFADEVERAAYFGLCVADWVSASGRRYGLVHGNDWQSGAAMLHLRDRFPLLPQLLTIHNGLYRGDLGGVDLAAAGLPAGSARRLAHVSRGRPHLLLAAALAADTAVTCSEAYAQELMTDADGDPLPAALRRIGLSGVMLGVDPDVWSPDATGRACVPFDASTVDAGKRSNRRVLRERLALRADDTLPLIGICSRLVPEKGTDLLLEALGPLLRARRLQLVLVGPATAGLQSALSALAAEAPGALAHVSAFDQDAAWLTYAGADLTVMPSRVEPGGLNQLIAFRYGTLPVVSPVGGLRDTVTDLRRHPATGTGFHIPEHTVDSVRGTVEAALEWMSADPARLTLVRRRVMAQDWSWARTAGKYAAVYARLTGCPVSGENPFEAETSGLGGNGRAPAVRPSVTRSPSVRGGRR